MTKSRTEMKTYYRKLLNRVYMSGKNIKKIIKLDSSNFQNISIQKSSFNSILVDRSLMAFANIYDTVVNSVHIHSASRINCIHFKNFRIIRNTTIGGSSLITGCIFYDVMFDLGHVNNSKFERCAFINTVFRDIDFTGDIFYNCSFSGCIFINCTFSTNPSDRHFKSCSFFPLKQGALGWTKVNNASIYPEYDTMIVSYNQFIGTKNPFVMLDTKDTGILFNDKLKFNETSVSDEEIMSGITNINIPATEEQEEEQNSYKAYLFLSEGF